jgi:ribosomal protein S18 acetylase RimI-like enzyme
VRFGAGSVRIEPLGTQHDRASFACGNETRDRYLKERATQDIRRGLARLFVATPLDDPTHILGFFTLSATAIVAADLPPEVAKRLPRYPIPAALIGRLAVDRGSAGRGLGGILLMDAIEKAKVAARTIAITVLVVDPIDDTAQSFYEAFGFHSLQGPQRRMFLTLPQEA